MCVHSRQHDSDNGFSMHMHVHIAVAAVTVIHILHIKSLRNMKQVCRWLEVSYNLNHFAKL